MDSLIVFSHLRWDFVYQRPQQLMTRLAKYYRIFYIEEPVFAVGPGRWHFSRAADNLIVCRPHTSEPGAGFHDEQLKALQPLVGDLIAQYDLREPLVWLYTPMALPLIAGLHARLVVYDCMGELSAFKNAPRQLLQREHALLKISDIVFTGGPSLYAAKRSRHDAVFCFPSSVEREHFAHARKAGEIRCQQHLGHPRLGFFGVIDERLDINLLNRLAIARPTWQIVLVGPVVKIDPASLPRHPNIHYFGQQTYADLPRFLAGWDICLLPFALNEATRFISPTKTLEYMASEKPIVSTSVPDVVGSHGDAVRIGDGAEFLHQCDLALTETPDEASRRSCAMRAAVAATSWDRTASQMHELMEAQRREAASHRISVPEKSLRATNDEGAARREPPVVIIGAGPTGLSAALTLGKDSLLLEQHATVGGWCRSIEEGGFTFDYAGHIMFSNDPFVHRLYSKLLGDNVHWQDREAWIYSKGVYTRYPFQGALYGLPPDVVAECIVGAIEARTGPLSKTPSGPLAPVSGSSPSACKADSITDCCADGLADSTTPLGTALKGAAAATAPNNFEEFIYQVWGAGIAKHFAVPYNRKLWAVPLTTMETSWLGGRVPLPDLQEMIEGALQPIAKPMGPNARFGYPLRGGFKALMTGFLPHLEGSLKLNARVTRIAAGRHQLFLEDGTSHHYEQLISTMPLPVLTRMIGDEAPAAVRKAAARLRHVSVRCVNLGIARAKLTEKHWIYYPESSVFHRIFVQGNASPHCNPESGFGLTCEITYSSDKPLPCEGDELTDLCIADCVKVGMLGADDRVIVRNQLDMPYAYVVYDHGRAASVATIRNWATSQDIILAGRYSEWEYFNSDHAFIAGHRAAGQARAARQRTESGERAADLDKAGPVAALLTAPRSHVSP